MGALFEKDKPRQGWVLQLVLYIYVARINLVHHLTMWERWYPWNQMTIVHIWAYRQIQMYKNKQEPLPASVSALALTPTVHRTPIK